MHHHDEKYTPGRSHNVVGNSFGGKLFVDGSAQGGQRGWAVAQINEATRELVCMARGAMPISLPVQRRTKQNSGLC